MFGPAVLVATLIGVTWLVLKSATYAVFPLGAIAIASGELGTGMSVPAVPVYRSIGVTS
jgi:hypothetical protein